MTKKKAPNGAGSFGRGAGNVAWVRVSVPAQPGKKAERPRVPIDGSEHMTDAQARRDGSNPVTRYLRPSRDADKLFCFLYPTEVLALLRGTSAGGETVIPLPRRVLYALAAYTGQRKGSLFALKWKHADFDHGTLASFKTKTGAAQYFVADRGLMVFLQAWRDHLGEPDDDVALVPEGAIDCEAKRLATALRDDLRAVGVTRPILFEDEAPNVEPLRFHDLRSTFCTWARRAGKSNVWIAERTGHEPTGDMINRYDRGAQTLGDLEYAPFPDVAAAIPELAPKAARLATRLATSDPEAEALAAEILATSGASSVGARGFEPPTPTVSSGTNPSEGPQGHVSTSGGEGATSAASGASWPCATPWGNAPDPVEAALAMALEGATEAREWATVAQLARELEARRLARTGNVVALDHARRRGR